MHETQAMTDILRQNSPSAGQGGADAFILGLFALMIGADLLMLSAGLELAQVVVHLCLVLCFSAFLLNELHNPFRDISAFISLPVILSASQNVYLAFVVADAPALNVKMMVITNYVLTCLFLFAMLFCGLATAWTKEVRTLNLLMILTLVYGLLLFAIFGGDPVSVFSSVRNLTAPPLFCAAGILASTRVSTNRFLKMLAVVGVIVVAFGFIERFIYPDLWCDLNISALWDKKGITNVSPGGLPRNFFSSEKINGEQIRRMTSSFADPVNLGTVLFLFLSVYYFLRKRLMLLLTFLAIVATVSKGAFLGVLILTSIWTYFYASRFIFFVALSVATATGVGFVIYSLLYATQSLLLHVQGFVASLKELPEYPLGRGLGNIGVLATQFGNVADTEITESGLGLLIGQLGVVGIILYSWLFICLFKAVSRIQDVRSRVLCLSLLISILVNITFNEVAMSPNSCAGYFLVIGVFIGRMYLRDLPQSFRQGDDV